MTYYASAKYLGRREGLNHNGTYTIEINEGFFGGVKVNICHGYENKRVIGEQYFFRYHSMYQFLLQWSVTDIEQRFYFKPL